MNLQNFNEKLSNINDRLIFAFFLSIILLYCVTGNILLKEQISICLVGLLFSFLALFKPAIFLTRQGYLTIKVFCLISVFIVSVSILIPQFFLIFL